MRGGHGILIGVEPVGAGGDDHVAAARAPAERRIIAHRRQLARLLVILDRLYGEEQAATTAKMAAAE